MTPIPNYLSTYQLHYFYYSLFGEYDGAGGVEMRGLEGVWRGASRHQSLIIYRPTSSYHHIRNSSYHHTSVVRMKEKEQCGDHTCSYHHTSLVVMRSGDDERGRW